MLASLAATRFMSWRLAGVTSTANGMLAASVCMLRLTPPLPRSCGMGPAFSHSEVLSSSLRPVLVSSSQCPAVRRTPATPCAGTSQTSIHSPNRRYVDKQVQMPVPSSAFSECRYAVPIVGIYRRMLGYARSMTSQRVRFRRWQQWLDLFPERIAYPIAVVSLALFHDCNLYEQHKRPL